MKKINKAWWVMVVACGLAASAIGVSINTSGVFYTPVSESLGLLKGSFSFHMTIFAIVTAISALVVPTMMTRYSYKRLLWISVLVATISTAAMALATQVWQFYLLAVIRGFSAGMFSLVPLTIIINHWFQEKNGLATSIVLSFSGVTGALLPSFFGVVIEQWGWQFGYIAKAVLVLLFCLPALFYPFKVKPQDEGKSAYGHWLNSTSQSPHKASDTKGTVNKAMFWQMVGFAFFLSFMASMTQHLPSYAQSVGKSALFGASLLSAGMLGNVISKLVIGILCDRIGVVKSTVLLMGVNLLGLVSLMWVLPDFIWLLAAFCYGSVFGLGAVATSLLSRHLFGTAAYVSVFPKVSFAANIGSAIAFSALGYIYDFTGSYRFALACLLAMVALNFALLYRLVRGTSSQQPEAL